jgi:hypothetical protein
MGRISTMLTRRNLCGTNALKLDSESFLLCVNTPFFCSDEIHWRPLKVHFSQSKGIGNITVIEFLSQPLLGLIQMPIRLPDTVPGLLFL